MQLEHSFTVPVPVDEAWQALLDVPRIAPCMPGATLTGMEGDGFTGTVKVKLGPITLTYQGKGRFVERDEAARRVVIEASGKDARSAGTARAMVTAALADQGGTTTVDVKTDLTVTGRPAQFGRGMIAEVGGKLIGQFAECLAREVSSGGAGSSAAATEQSAAATEQSAAATEQSAAATERSAVAPAAQSTPDGPVLAAPAKPAPPAEAEAIDVLRLTGSTDTARRLAVYGLGALLLAVVVGVVIRRSRRSRA